MPPSPDEETHHARVVRIRSEVNALVTVTEEEAKAAGAAPVTSTYYAPRLIGQSIMLLAAVKDYEKCRPGSVFIVKNPKGFVIWRKP